jgi:hypothetical protein
MSATLTPLARHARMHQPGDHFALPWMRSAAGLHYRDEADKAANSAGIVDAAAVRKAWQATEYAAGHRDGFFDGKEVGERRGMQIGWYWGAACGAFATALVALVAGFALVSWQADDIGALPASGSSKAPTTSTPAPRIPAPALPAPWSAGT